MERKEPVTECPKCGASVKSLFVTSSHFTTEWVCGTKQMKGAGEVAAYSIPQLTEGQECIFRQNKILSEENKHLKSLLDEATTWLVYGTPEAPNHQCGTDSSCCDGLCQNYASYCEFTAKVRKVLKDWIR